MLNFKIKYVLLLFTALIDLQCVNGSSKTYSNDLLNKVSDSKEKIVYVEYKEDTNGMINNGFGKIVMFDVENRTKIKFTDDKTINKNPSFSTDGKKIYFFSTMDADSKTVQILGDSTPKRIFCVDISKDVISRFNFPPEKKILRHNISIREFQQVNDSLFFFLVDNSIYSFNKNRNFVQREYSVKDSSSIIKNYLINKNGSLLAINLKTDVYTPEGKIIIYNFFDKKGITISNYKYGIRLGNWSIDGDTLCYTDSVVKLYSYLNNKTIKVNTNKLVDKEIQIQEAHLLSDNGIILLGAKKDEKIKATHQSYDLYLLNLSTNKIEQLTNDGNLKEQISVYYRRN